MKIFIAGATGVLGRRVVKQLLAGGHQVIGLSRSPANTVWLSQNGAEARPGDLFNAAHMAELSAGCDAILHLATAIPTKTRSSRRDWALNDRIRTDGTRALVDAAVRNQCRVYVQQSITFIYGEHGDEWVDEGTPVATEPGGILQSAVEMEQIVAQSAKERGLPTAVLRLGMFYCYDSAHTRAILDSARRGQFPIIGNGEPFWSQIQVDDAAGAVVAAVESHAKAIGHTYNVVDDEPARYREVAAFIAQSVGARPPMRLPAAIARPLVGVGTVSSLTTSIRVRNQRIKDELGWKPSYPSYREGYRAEIKKRVVGGGK
jgi:nucleoside-diphosphate-sugar epimerase